MRFSRLYAEDTKAIRRTFDDSEPLQLNGYNLQATQGSYNHVREDSLILETTDFDLLIGIGCIIVRDCGQEEVWVRDPAGDIWVCEQIRGILKVTNSETQGRYRFKS